MERWHSPFLGNRLRDLVLALGGKIRRVIAK